LEELLAHDVELHGDGGGRVRTIARPVHGRLKVARVLLRAMRTAEPFGGWLLRQVHVNGQPGVMVSDAADELHAVLVLDVAAEGRISAVRSIVNPDKLRHLRQDATS
jgi:RNA polymerase sigma-70 factor (ECF subfamily)